MNVRGIYCKIELDGRVRTLIFLCEVKKKNLNLLHAIFIIIGYMDINNCV